MTGTELPIATSAVVPIAPLQLAFPIEAEEEELPPVRVRCEDCGAAEYISRESGTAGHNCGTGDWAFGRDWFEWEHLQTWDRRPDPLRPWGSPRHRTRRGSSG